MITVAILAILVTLTVAAYQSYTKRAKRAEGRSFLLDAAARMERYYSTNATYPDTDIATKLGYLQADPKSPEGYYTLTVQTGVRGVAYELTAAPAFTDDECGKLIYNSNKEKEFDAVHGDLKKCWGDVRKE